MFVFMLTIILTIPIVRADIVTDVRERIAQIMTELPERRKNPEMLWNYDVVFATNASQVAMSCRL